MERDTRRPRRLDLGLAAPVFAAPGIPTLRTPSIERLDWEGTRRSIELAEELGLDSVWFSDHLFHGRDGEFLECWTTLCAAAGMTQRIRLVTNHLGVRLRSAPLIAKMAATADVISGGRFELFLSHGLREREHTSYGFGWDADDARRRHLAAEAVDVIRALWSGDFVDHEGEAYRLRGALSSPAPAHDIPVWLGGPLADDAVRMIAETADGWNALPTSVDHYAEQAARIDAACRAIGRDPTTLRRSLETQVLVLEGSGVAGESEWDEWMAHWAELRSRAPLGRPTDDMIDPAAPLDDSAVTAACRSTFVIGTAQEVAERLREYHALGVDEVACWLMDWPAERTLRALASDVRKRLDG